MVTLAAQRKSAPAGQAPFLQRVAAISVLIVFGGWLVFGMMHARFAGGELGLPSVLLLVLIFAAFEMGRAILNTLLVGIFGDVQIYTTHDENCHFFDLRARILAVTVDAMLRAVSPSIGGRSYDHVVIVAHSLGSTVSMDALFHLYQLREQGGLSQEDFGRIRSFVTFGTALEKTRYFFDVARTDEPIPYGRWRQDVLGLLFTGDAAEALENGGPIFWTNYWYFADPICNEIESFRSHLYPGDALDDADVRRSEWTGDPGGRLVCRNELLQRRLSLTRPLIHGDYLDDDAFWLSSPDGTRLGVLELLDVLREPDARQAIA